MKPKLQRRPLPTAEAIAREAAIGFLGLLLRRPDPGAPFGLALSGGRIASTFYAAIVAAAAGRAIPFDSVHFFWADERCVPPSDPENNYAIARQHLFAPLQVPEVNIHRILAEADRTFAVEQAEAEICRILPLSSAGQPVLDLVILGLGEDGHIASLFPGEPEQTCSDPKVFRRVLASKPPPERITLGYPALIAARDVWVLASGAGKRKVLEQLVQGDRSLPISRLAAARSETVIFHDAPLPVTDSKTPS